MWAQERRDQMMNALKHSLAIWESIQDQSIEAYKAGRVLSVMLEKLMAHQALQGALNAYANPANHVNRNKSYGVLANGNMSMPDDVAPEHSAAMTLGLLSSGGISPNAGFGTSTATSATPTNGTGNLGSGMNMNVGMSAAGETRPYPASMAGILNEPFPERERTGLTPNASGPETGAGAMNGALSPFSQLFGQSAMGIDGGAADLDWVSIASQLHCSHASNDLC